MSGLRSRNKGKSGEREIASAFIALMHNIETELGLPHTQSEEIKRNTLQSDRGGFDIVGIPLLGVEVKRCEVLNLNDWWKQTCDQANKYSLLPVLIYRGNRTKWRVQTFTVLGYSSIAPKSYVRSDMTLDDFMLWYNMLYRWWLLKGK